jgi:pimeloyl-ACP methyl ester carboxylesterase
MGAAVVERIIGTRPVRAAALVSPVPPGGLAPMLGRLIVQQPEYLIRMPQFNPLLTLDILAGLRPMYFSDAVAPEILAESDLHLFPESPRALLDMTLRLHDARPAVKMQPFVLGASADRVATPGDVRATAAMYGVKATIVPGLAHMLMLEPEWQTAARPLLDWLEREVAPRGAKQRATSVRGARA